jgi:type IV secretory pathway VirB4 component
MAKSLSTQEFVELQEVRDGVVFLKNGALRQLLIVSGVNFDLKSETEQDLMTYAYQNLLNALDFSIQIFIHSRRLNIESYLQKLQERHTQETNELLKTQIAEYLEFIKSFVANNAIMDKTFFVVVPYDPVYIPQAAKGLMGFVKKAIPGQQEGSPTSQKKDESENLQQNLQQLRQRVDQAIAGLQQIGLRAIPLDTEESIELIYNLYNPQMIERGNLEIAKE